MYRQLNKILFILALFLILPHVAQAGFLDQLSYCTTDGSCGFTDIAKGFNFLIKFLLGSMGVVALLFFTWGGIQWLVSGGNAERIQRGKQIMINTVFSIIIAFGSYLIVSFFINDVLNADDSFRVQQGEFKASCEELAAGDECETNAICSGELPGNIWSNKCLNICVLGGLADTGYIKEGECIDSVDLVGGEWVPVPRGNAGCAGAIPESQKICAYRS